MILKGQLSADTALLIDCPVLMRADPAAADQLIPPQQMEKLSVKQLEDRPADDVQLVKPVIVFGERWRRSCPPAWTSTLTSLLTSLLDKEEMLISLDKEDMPISLDRHLDQLIHQLGGDTDCC